MGRAPKDDPDLVIRRKQDHLDLCLNEEVESPLGAGWDSVRLPHKALPERDLDRIDASATLLGRRYAAPILISSMTGGSPQGERINLRLAAFAEGKRIPMGVGSQRVALENKSQGFFGDLRKAAPQASLFANIGAVQLNCGVEADDCAWLVESLDAQALFLHCNPLQEAVQEEGDHNFSGLLRKMEAVAKRLPVPVILKETGCGIDPQTARSAIDAGVAAIDVAGRGGSHWGLIEGLRNTRRRALGEIFKDWGRSSAEATRACVEAVGGQVPVIASGGIRSGLDIAKALSLGASFCGMALPLLKAAADGDESLEAAWGLHVEALRIALFCQGLGSVGEAIDRAALQ